MKITIQELIYNSLKEKGEKRTLINYQKEAETLDISQDIYERCFNSLIESGRLINVIRTKDGAAVTIV